MTESPLLQSLWGPRMVANGPQHLGLCDDQVPGDLESGYEGTQLNLLVGANRKSVPKRNQTKGKNREYHGRLPFDKRTVEIKDGTSAEGGKEAVKLYREVILNVSPHIFFSTLNTHL